MTVVAQNGLHWIEKEVTRKGKTFKMWFRVRDPQAPKASRAKKVTQRDPELDDAQAAAVLKRAGVDVRTESGTTISAACKSVFGRALTEKELLGLTAAAEWKAQYSTGFSAKLYFSKGRLQYSAHGDVGADYAKNSSMTRGWVKRRDSDPPYAYHNTFFVGKDFQGQGFGKSVLKSQLGVYQQLGLDHVKLDAIEIGKYYWPKLGFQAHDFKEHKQEFQEWLARPSGSSASGAYGAGLSKQVAAKVAEKSTSSHELVTAEVDGRRVGKEWATGPYGSGGEMRLDLKPGSVGFAAAKRELGL